MDFLKQLIVSLRAQIVLNLQLFYSSFRGQSSESFVILHQRPVQNICQTLPQSFYSPLQVSFEQALLQLILQLLHLH